MGQYRAENITIGYSSQDGAIIKMPTVQGDVSETCLYVGDARDLYISVIRGNASSTYASITPDSATIQVKETDDTEVLAETAASISGSKVYYPANVDVITASARRLIVTWKIVYEDEIASLLHYLTVQER